MTPSLRNRIIFVLLLATAVRGAVLWNAHGFDFGTAAAFKLADVARNILEGRGFQFDQAYLNRLNAASLAGNPAHPELEILEKVSPSDKPEYKPFRGRPPGYSVLLGLTWKVFGHRKFIYAQTLTAALDVFSCLLVFLLARQLFGEKVGFWSGVLYAISLPLATLSIFPIHDSISAGPIIGAAFLIWHAVRKNIVWPLALTGLVGGVGSLIRQEVYFVPVIFALAFLMFRRWKWGILLFLITQLVVVSINIPWSLRNKRMFGKSQVFSSSYAANFFGGLASEPNPWNYQANDPSIQEFVRQKAGDLPIHSPEFNQVLWDAFVSAVKEHPSVYLRGVGNRFVKFISPTIMPFEASYTQFFVKKLGKSGMLNYAVQYPWQFTGALLSKLMWWILWLGVIILILRNFRIPRDDTMKPAFLLGLLGIALFYWWGHIPMHTESRFVLPGYFPIVILGVAGWLKSGKQI